MKLIFKKTTLTIVDEDFLYELNNFIFYYKKGRFFVKEKGDTIIYKLYNTEDFISYVYNFYKFYNMNCSLEVLSRIDFVNDVYFV